MFISMSIVATFLGALVLVLVYLVYHQAELSEKVIKDAQFFLDQKTIAENRLRAELAILKGKYNKLNTEFTVVEAKLEEKNKLEETRKQEIAQQKRIFDEKTSEITKLEGEITSIEQTINGSIKKSLTQYMKEVDGLKTRLQEARDEVTASFNIKDLENHREH